MTPCIDVYKAKLSYDESLDKLKVKIAVIGDLKIRDFIGDTWSPTASMRNLKYFLAYYFKHKEKVNQLFFIGVFLQANVKHQFL